MFCPKCRSEYSDGILKCPDCDVDLVDDLTDERRPEAALVPLLRTHNPGDIAIIRSILDGSDIRYYIQGENMLHVRQMADPAILLVASDDLEDAKELLKDLDLSFMGISYHEQDHRYDR
jgi:hypothetical protein